MVQANHESLCHRFDLPPYIKYVDFRKVSHSDAQLPDVLYLRFYGLPSRGGFCYLRAFEPSMAA
jgi:hypothetical protein